MGWGWNPLEVPGGTIGDGGTGRITDPVTGAGLFNPNMDPAISGIDPITGSEAPVGTDLSFGSMVRRQMQTNVLNGDFAVPPPNGAGTAIVSDPNDSGYNPLPGWTWVPPSNGRETCTIEANASLASGYVCRVTPGAGSTGGGYLEQLIPVPMSQGQQFRALPSLFGWAVSSGDVIKYQYLRADATTTIGSEISKTLGTTETKVDAGLVPPTAGYLRLRWQPDGTLTSEVAEVRCAFLPAEATLGLKSIAANVGAFSTTETQVVGATIPAGSFSAGSVYRIRAFGLVVANSAAHTVTFRCRVGTTTLTGNVAATRGPTTTGSAASDPFSIEVLVTCRSTGASGTVMGGMVILGNATQPFNAAQFLGNTGSTVTVDTTVANILELTAVTSNAGTTVAFHQATIECVMAS